MKILRKVKKYIGLLGPGVVTGAADDDPSGIATYTQTGAQFGYSQLWTAVYLLPLLIVVQETCARIGAVTGKGLAAVVKEHYNKWILYGLVALILISNTVNIGADIGAMAASARLIIPLPFAVLTLLFTAFILILEIFTSYKVYSRILKWLAVSLAAYLFTLVLVAQPWREILVATFLPHIEFNTNFLFIITGVIGTTISPYMFFWEASEEVEEEHQHHMFNQDGAVKMTPTFLRRLRKDNAIGMIASQVATWAIIAVAATVLHRNGIIDIRTAADAAYALEPLVHTFPNSGFIAKLIFAVGVIGLGLLAVPVLSGSASYALAETFNWREGLNQKLKRAHGFYGVITISTILGLAINFVGIDPVKALVYTAVLNGVASVPLLLLLAMIGHNRKIMGEYVNGKLFQSILWLTFFGMLITVGSLFVTFIHS